MKTEHYTAKSGFAALMRDHAALLAQLEVYREALYRKAWQNPENATEIAKIWSEVEKAGTTRLSQLELEKATVAVKYEVERPYIDDGLATVREYHPMDWTRASDANQSQEVKLVDANGKPILTLHSSEGQPDYINDIMTDRIVGLFREPN